MPRLVLQVIRPARSCPWMAWELRGCLEGRPGYTPTHLFPGSPLLAVSNPDSSEK